MKHSFFIIFFFPLSLLGQTFELFNNQASQTLAVVEDSLTEKDHSHFLNLIRKRDVVGLSKRLDTIDASVIVIVEGYNFEKHKYSIYEEYKFFLSDAIFGKCLSLLNGQLLSNCHIYVDSADLKASTLAIDTIYPRKYKYGMGCLATKSKIRTANRLKKKAESERIVIEPYCRIETIIMKHQKRVITRYLISVAGKRETEIVSGMNTEWRPGLDFWLFTTPDMRGN